MSSSPKQMVSTHNTAVDLLTHLIDQLSSEQKSNGSTSTHTKDRAISSGPSTTHTTAFHSSNDSNSSAEIIRNITDLPIVDNFSTSTVLHYCKRNVLIPYQNFLSMLGLRPITTRDDGGVLSQIGIVIYTTVVILFTFLAYILQYASCFRRDLISGYKVVQVTNLNGTATTLIVCKGTLMNTYFIPDILHMSAYAFMFYLIRIRENEQLQVLMERVFLQAFYSRSNYISQPKVVKTLRLFLSLTFGWIILSVLAQIIHIFADFPSFTWMEPKNKYADVVLIVLLIITILWTDLIHITIVASYSIQCQLLITFIRGLCERVREKSLSLEEAIKEISESAKILKYLNEDFAISVALAMLHAGMMVVSGFIWAASLLSSISEIRQKDALVILFNFLCIILWTSSFTFPLIQAARLTAACHCFQKLGLYIMTRPFGYQDIPLTSLQPFLCYTASLKMQAKLFRVPVKPWALFGLSTLICCVILILSQCNIIKLGI